MALRPTVGSEVVACCRLWRVEARLQIVIARTDHIDGLIGMTSLDGNRQTVEDVVQEYVCSPERYSPDDGIRTLDGLHD